MVDSKIDCDTKPVLFGVNAGPLLNGCQSGLVTAFSVAKSVLRGCDLGVRFTKSRELTHEEIPMNINLAMIEPTDDGVLEDLAKKRVHRGEEALMFAVLKSATEDFQEYVNARDRKGKLLFDEAEEWLLEKDSDSILCFESICEVLRLQPDYLRQGLLRWKEAHCKSEAA
jgi:hypothetical protein